ncbi:hypothetical protein ASD42_21235 [Nocardia sp. Root136]|uniref:hypothetical protein n=1 Tax=Nocardia sp. Root136 TaxID=1736458 RepID=UPI0006F98795|nr:hypothetical protein [Nocardia sp. Root136]KQY32137.1 hypothetical protein ASD42_21235 [Nocardia sp. Root136]
MTGEDWRHNGVRVIKADPLDPNTLECVLVRSDSEAVVVNLEIEPIEKPEAVHWIDPIHHQP